jgi:hypothetical protein
MEPNPNPSYESAMRNLAYATAEKKYLRNYQSLKNLKSVSLLNSSSDMCLTHQYTNNAHTANATANPNMEKLSIADMTMYTTNAVNHSMMRLIPKFFITFAF